MIEVVATQDVQITIVVHIVGDRVVSTRFGHNLLPESTWIPGILIKDADGLQFETEQNVVVSVAVEVCDLQLVRSCNRVDQCLVPYGGGRRSRIPEQIKAALHVCRVGAENFRGSIAVDVTCFYRLPQAGDGMKLPAASLERVFGTLHPTLCCQDVEVTIAVHIVDVNSTASVLRKVDLLPTLLADVQPEPRVPMTTADHVET